MEIIFHASHENSYAEIISDRTIIFETQDTLDLMADCRYQGADGMIIRREHLTEDFFDLRTGIAGDILQKISNYRFRLAIIGDFSNFTSKSLRDFIYESNKHRQVIFVSSLEDAIKEFIVL
ncbi:MAG: DUF4180 domain-containing protein [Bacteroidales bacterium]|nr:DUF4180 domain-containing protein [Bacteroidales bacterium]